MATLRERLDAHEGQPEQKWAVRKNVAVGERGQNFLAMFSPERLSAVYAVDGGIIKDKKTQKCDKLILTELDGEQWLELFVELKGRDIRHAIEQVESTIKNPLFQDAKASRQARIIGRDIPRNTGRSITEIAKKNFISKYNCRLEFKTGPAKELFKV